MATTNRTMTDNPIVLRIIGLIKDQGNMEKDLADHLGVSPGTMSKWKYDGNNVYLKYIEPICEFLETTPNYLFWGVQNGEMSELTPVEVEIVRNYRKAGKEGRKCVRTMLNLLVDKNEGTKS